jgi:hypothetical protein
MLYSLQEQESVVGYVVLSPDGIPIKYHEKMPYVKAVMYAGLAMSFVQNSRLALKALFIPSEVCSIGLTLNDWGIRASSLISG